MSRADFVEIVIVLRCLRAVSARLVCGATRPMLRHSSITDSPEVPSTRTLSPLKDGDGTDDHNRR
jgi:hypothetical protein